MVQESNRQQAYTIWQAHEVAQNFLDGVRGAVPLAGEQIDCILRIIQATQSKVSNFLDLGCGNGILGKAIARKYPHSQGVFLDLSATMLKAAEENLSHNSDNYHFILEDFAQGQWLKSVQDKAPFNVIVSGFAIHHLPDTRKYKLYQEIYQLLQRGGLFLNLEHIASHSQLGENLFDELFIDNLYAFHQQQGSNQSRTEIGNQYYHRPDKSANILSPVESQCDWLREIGFTDVDCFLKIFEIALFGGIRAC